MKKILLALFALSTIVACNDADKGGNSDSAVDAARNFVRAALDGDYQRAKTYMVSDSTNDQDLHAAERLNDRLTPDQKKSYKSASIRIHENKEVNDSTALIMYSNSFKNEQNELKVVKIDGKWLVDFKHMFSHKPDSAQ